MSGAAAIAVPKPWILAGAMGLWLLFIWAGTAAMWRYELTPAPRLPSSPLWPSASRASAVPGLPALVVAIHPRCPCSRATLHELERIMARCRGRLSATVLLLDLGPAAPPDWTDMTALASGIPDVRVLRDEGKREIGLFGASTSGEALLFDPQGRLVFHGGITGARGHEGDNPGEQAVLDWTLEGASTVRESPVFGCSLGDPPGAGTGTPAGRST